VIDLDDETLDYALRCAATLLDERSDPSELAADDGPAGRIMRWVRDHPEPD
jgi:hypothetical protein